MPKRRASSRSRSRSRSKSKSPRRGKAKAKTTVDKSTYDGTKCAAKQYDKKSLMAVAKDLGIYVSAKSTINDLCNIINEKVGEKKAGQLVAKKTCEMEFNRHMCVDPSIHGVTDAKHPGLTLRDCYWDMKGQECKTLHPDRRYQATMMQTSEEMARTGAKKVIGKVKIPEALIPKSSKSSKPTQKEIEKTSDVRPCSVKRMLKKVTWRSFNQLLSDVMV